MSRRTNLLEQLLQTDTFGAEAKDQQEKLRITAELILCDMVDLALNGVQVKGAGSLFVNLIDADRWHMLALTPAMFKWDNICLQLPL